jgi:MFS family permease
MGWRACFLIGALLGLPILVSRIFIPESPRWLVTHGRAEEADAVVAEIEGRFLAHGHVFPPEDLATMRFSAHRRTSFRDVFNTLFRLHRSRALVGLSLMTAQAFFYNAIFFTYALVLTDFYAVPASHVGWYILPFAAGNFLGPLLLGRLFDTVGRRKMIALTYAASGILLSLSGWAFAQGLLTATTQTAAWMVIFFFASAAASSAYLTVSETFPLEMRALAIAIFYAVGTGLGGVAGPALFGALIETGSRGNVFAGYLLGSGLMIGAAIVAAIWGFAAERKSLETVARPLTFVD